MVLPVRRVPCAVSSIRASIRACRVLRRGRLDERSLGRSAVCFPSLRAAWIGLPSVVFMTVLLGGLSACKAPARPSPVEAARARHQYLLQHGGALSPDQVRLVQGVPFGSEPDMQMRVEAILRSTSDGGDGPTQVWEPTQVFWEPTQVSTRFPDASGASGWERQSVKQRFVPGRRAPSLESAAPPQKE